MTIVLNFLWKIKIGANSLREKGEINLDKKKSKTTIDIDFDAIRYRDIFLAQLATEFNKLYYAGLIFFRRAGKTKKL